MIRMNRTLLPALVALTLGAARLTAQDTVPAPLAQARAALSAGRLDEAINLASHYTSDRPRDERGYLILGDAWFKEMPVGRFRALEAYRQAQRWAPRDPEAAYRYALVGLWLGGDDGESVAKQGLDRVLHLDPTYRDAWDMWLTLFRNAGDRRRALEWLAPYATNPIIRSRMALLAIEDERYDDADRLLDSALAADSTNTAWLALRAQSAFEAGDTVSGWEFYRRALAHADRDSTDALWNQVIGIAWSWEVRDWAAGVAPERKREWLESFWARRNPNLFAGVNHRVAEHFARLRYARKHYPLLHPFVSYHRSQIARAMNLEPSVNERAYFQRCEMYEVLVPPSKLPDFVVNNPDRPKPVFDDRQGWYFFEGYSLPGVSHASDQKRVNLDPYTVTYTPDNIAFLKPWERNTAFFPLNLDLRSLESIAARIGYNLATGLDDRGVMFLRLGPPDGQFVGGNNPADPMCASPDVEKWRYADYGEVRFSRPSAFSHGERNVPDMVFRAMNERQFETVRTGLTRDASSEAAPLDFGVWTAQFADTSGALTDVVVVSTRGEVAASLVSEAEGEPPVQESRSGAVAVSETPGHYTLLAQALDSGQLGRQTLQIEVKAFDRLPAVSDLLMAPAWGAGDVDRGAMLAHVERTLVFPQGSPIRSFAEVYGLFTRSGMVRYRVEYELLKTNSPERDISHAQWPEATRFSFVRERRASGTGTVGEILDITPDRVPPGKYLLRLHIVDALSGQDAGRASIAFAVR